MAAAEAQAERPRRRRTSSRTRKRTLSGRSISDHSDMEVDASDIDKVLAHQAKQVKGRGHKRDSRDRKDSKDDSKDVEPSKNNEHSVLNGSTMEISDDHSMNGNSNSDSVAGSGSGSSEFQSELESLLREVLFSRHINVASMRDLNTKWTLRLAARPPGSASLPGLSEATCEQTVIKLGGTPLKSKVRLAFALFT